MSAANADKEEVVDLPHQKHVYIGGEGSLQRALHYALVAQLRIDAACHLGKPQLRSECHAVAHARTPDQT